MTKKDYELIAGALLTQRYSHGANDLTTINELCQLLAAKFVGNDPRFDRIRFLQSCGSIPTLI